MADVIDFTKKKKEGEDENLLIYPCVCGSMFWLKTSEGDICGFCDTPFEALEFNTED